MFQLVTVGNHIRLSITYYHLYVTKHWAVKNKDMSSDENSFCIVVYLGVCNVISMYVCMSGAP